MEFGVFDHLDRDGPALTPDFYETRLRLAERYDAAGLRAYHVAEHHGTPLGMAPSPNLFLAALAQRTKRLRFGPLVYCLPLYHPVRLIEEICMLDQMSGGRLEMGIGRGISPFEVGYFGVDYADGPALYREALRLILEGLAGGTLTFHGTHYTVEDMAMELAPVQRPHPPLWLGVHDETGAVWPAENGINVVASNPADEVRRITDRYREAWSGPSDAMPRLGMNRFLCIAETDAEARAVAARAYPVWRRSIMTLWRRHDSRPRAVDYVETFEELEARGQGIAGSPARVAEEIARQIEQAGITYFVCRFAYGDISRAEALRSVDLFAERVMPQLGCLAGARAQRS